MAWAGIGMGGRAFGCQHTSTYEVQVEARERDQLLLSFNYPAHQVGIAENQVQTSGHMMIDMSAARWLAYALLALADGYVTEKSMTHNVTLEE